MITTSHWRAALAALAPIALSACVAVDEPSVSSSSPSSTASISSSEAPINSSSMSSVTAISSVMPISSSESSSFESSIALSSSEPSSLSEFSSSISISSSQASESSSSNLNSSSSESSSEPALPAMVSCEFSANLNGGNYFNAETFNIINNDSRNVGSWTVTLEFTSGSFNGVPDVLRNNQGQVIANASKDGNTITVTGSQINAMTTLAVSGLQFGSSGIQAAPTCELHVELEGDASNPGEPFAPAEYVVEDLEAYFAQFKCGVDFSAMGNGGYAACYRTEQGGARCVSKASEAAKVLKWADGSEVRDVLHVSGSGQSNYAAVVTTDGALFAGNVDGIPKTAIIASDVVSTTGAYDNSSCALIGAPGARRVECWRGALKQVEFPEPVEPVQISGSYGASCALSDKGEIWCWQQGGGASIPGVMATPTKMPFSHPMIFLSVGQRAVCGIRATGGVDCAARWGDAFFLPVTGDGDASKVTANLLGDAHKLQAGFVQGIVINHDGSAYYAPGAYGNTPRDTSHFVPFTGVDNAIASGGKRYAYCVLTRDGDVKCLDETSKNVVSFTDEVKAQTADCPY